MPGRKHPFITGGIYHVYNKSIEGRKIFDTDALCEKFLQILWYYRSTASLMRLSNLSRLGSAFKKYYIQSIENTSTFRVSICAYCIMPTHYHVLLRQNSDGGISHFISQIQNSFTRYSNVKHKRSGYIFIHRFHSKPITSDEVFKHVSRYIHLNPYSSGIVDDLFSYPWSSLHEYVRNNRARRLCDTTLLMQLFNHDNERYKRFVLNNADYQKTLEICKYADHTSEV